MTTKKEDVVEGIDRAFSTWLYTHMNGDTVSTGVDEAMSFWLNQHPVSMGELIEAGIRKALDGWLATNGEDIKKEVARIIAAGITAQQEEETS